MKAIKTNGEEIELRPFQAVCGTRFNSLTITSEDEIPSDEVRLNKFSVWLTNILLTRVMSPESK